MSTPPPAGTQPAAGTQPSAGQPSGGTQPAESSYLGDLPAIFAQTPFAGQFLLAFETMLSAPFWPPGPVPAPAPAGQPPGLETTIGHVADYLDPETTRADFLPWLAGWVALSLRADWDEPTRRDFIGQIVSLYQQRGTLPGLLKMLSLYTREPVKIWDHFDGPPYFRPYFFQVQLTLTATDQDRLDSVRQIARAIIDQEKPAHTYYALQIAIPTMRLVSRALSARENVPMLILGTWKDTTNACELGTQLPGPPAQEGPS